MGITQILVSQKMAINVVGSHDPMSLTHEAHISFRSTKANFHWSLSGCGEGSLEICTHVILMPELCIYIPNLTPFLTLIFESKHPPPMLVIGVVSILVY